MIRWTALITLLLFCHYLKAQDYVGYSKSYILKSMKSKKEMTTPISYKDEWSDYIVYVSKDGKRAVYYHFVERDVPMDGNVIKREICYKYVSKTKCLSNTECPSYAKVINSLNSHFTNEGTLRWVDYSRKVPHQWIVVKEDNYFEVHVTELH